MCWVFDNRAASTFANSESGDTLFDDNHGRVTYARRTYPTASLDLEVYRDGGAATKVVGYLPESAVQSRASVHAWLARHRGEGWTGQPGIDMPPGDGRWDWLRWKGFMQWKQEQAP